MRPPRALGPARLSIIFFLTLVAYANSQSQKQLLCKYPGTRKCLLWLVNLQDVESNTDVHTSKNIPHFCVLSDKQFIPHHGKYIKVRQVEKMEPLKQIICKKVILLGRLFNWTEVENALSSHIRIRRQNFTPRGRYRGQTQSQYLSIDRGNGKDEGRAEAHSAADSSRASVSGNSGMGQAQSQSIYDPNCDDCYGKSNHEVENLKRPIESKPGDNAYGTNSGATWPGYEGFGPTRTHNGGNNPTDTHRYIPEQKVPGVYGSIEGPQSFSPNSKPNDKNFQSSGMGPIGSSNVGNGSYRPNGATNNEYSPAGIGVNGYRLPGVPTNSGYGPVGNAGTFVPNGVSNRNEPHTNGMNTRYMPNDTTGGFGPGTNRGLGEPNSRNNYGTGHNGNGYAPNGSQGGNRPDNNSGINRGPGVDNYLTNQDPNGNIYSHRLEDTQANPGGNFVPQNGMYGPGNTINNNQAMPGGSGGNLRPGTSNTGYSPGQLGANFAPNLGNEAAGGTYNPDGRLTGSPGFGTGQTGTPNMNWPIASGPYAGPGGNIYCCVIPNNGLFAKLYPNSYEAGKELPNLSGSQTPYGITGQQGINYRPDGQYGTSKPGSTSSGGYYNPGADGGRYGPNVNSGSGPTRGQYIPGGTGGSSIPGSQYGPGGAGGSPVPGGQYAPGDSGGTMSPGGQYGPGGAGGSSVPGGQYGPGGRPTPGSEYGPGGPGSSSVPGGQYVPSGTGGNTLPGGQYVPGGSAIPGGQYGPGGAGSSSVPGGQYVPGGTGGSTIPGGQYGPGGPGSSALPGGQYTPAGTGSTTLPGGHYGPGVTSGSSVPGGKYAPGGTSGSTIPGSQYGPGGLGGSSVPGGQYTPGGPSGTTRPGGQYGPGGTGSSSLPGGQYIPGGTGSSSLPEAQYGPGGAGSSSVPGGQYVPGGIGGSTIPGSQYGPSGAGSSSVPGGQYVPSGTGGSTIPGGQYGPGGPGSSALPGGQYTPGGTGSTTLPGGHYGPGVTSGSSVPGGQYAPGGTGGSTIPRSQYRPSGLGGSSIPGGQYTPGGTGGTSQPGGQFVPNGAGSSSLPGGQYIPGGTGGSSLPAGQYGPGGAGSFSVPGGQYAPGGTGGSTIPENQYGAGGAGGSLVPGGQYVPDGTGGSNIPGSQYGPGGAGSSSLPGGKYIPNGTGGSSLPGGQYGPGGTGGSSQPGGHYIPGGSGGSSIPGGSGGSSIPGGQYIPGGSGGSSIPGGSGGSSIPGGQYIPGGVGGSSMPGGQYRPGGPGDTTIHGGQYGPDTGIRPNEDLYGHQGGLPGSNRQYGTSPQGYYNQGGPGGQNNEYNGIPQNYLDPNTAATDGDDSEAQANVAQNVNGTTASASSKGGNDKGRAQTSVQGTYTGSGSFQAQAQITGENKEAQSEVNGGKKGASSSASGSGRNNKSQANVQLGSETGSVQTQSQTSGVMHSSNSQVQGSVKGGMADAQARGPGSTSSQAQIGFTPYKDDEKSSHDLQQIPFTGGGLASAQSSGRTGQSQSQLHGTFKYGITYNGAAQSGASIDKDAVFPNRLSFEKINVFDEKDKNINVDKINIDITETPQSLDSETPPFESSTLPESLHSEEKVEVSTTENIIDESMKNSESRYTGHAHIDHHTPSTANSTLSNGPTLLGNRRSFQNNYGNIPDYEFTTDKEETQPEYDTDVGFEGEGNEASDVEQNEYSNYDEYPKESPTHQYLQSSNRKGLEVQQTTGGNTQHIILGSLKDHNAEIIQKDTERPDEGKVYQPGERVPGTGGYTIPVGFTGSVKSVASKDKTYVVGSKDYPSQAQTVTLTPGTGKVKYTNPLSYGKYVKPKNLRSLQSPKHNDNRYVSVSKSVTRALDSDNNIRKQYSHTYYTKSSSCGYFTFTCTMVSSAEGKKKVCKPKMPTNPDGTPIRC